MHGNDWQGNGKDFSYVVGKIQHMPVFDKRIDPSTNQVIAGTTQVNEMKTIYTIPFTKAKVNELSKYFVERIGFVVVDKTSGRKYSCSLEEFRDMGYEELVNLKTGFTDYIRTSNWRFRLTTCEC